MSSTDDRTAGAGRFAGRRVLVTGASRGIGADVAVAFARGGAAVALNGRSESEALADVASRCRDAGASQVVLAVGDVSDAEQASGVVRQAQDELGGLDVLVNNAGTLDSAPLVDMEPDQWDAMIASDLRSVYLCTHAALPGMVERGWGRVINITSQLAVKGAPGMAHYSAAKAGVIGFTRSVAQEVAGKGVLVNAVAPGPVDTDMTGDLDDEWKQEKTSQLPLGRFATVEEITPSVLLLAADPDGNVYVGQTLHPNSGDVMP
jgi:3-oxoacyl-[acyl-carrier protein] reductase